MDRQIDRQIDRHQYPSPGIIKYGRCEGLQGFQRMKKMENRKFFLNLKSLLIQDTNSVYFCGSQAYWP